MRGWVASRWVRYRQTHCHPGADPAEACYIEFPAQRGDAFLHAGQPQALSARARCFNYRISRLVHTSKSAFRPCIKSAACEDKSALELEIDPSATTLPVGGERTVVPALTCMT